MSNIKIIILLLLLSGIIYANSLSNPFIWDDLVLIVENPQIKHLSNIFKIFTSALAPDPFSNNTLTIFYRPLQILVYLFDYAIFRLQPWGYHLTNILLHIGCLLLVYSLINLITKDKMISIITSVLFAIHPIHTEAVTYISGNADILAAFFFLLTLITYIKYIHTAKSKSFYIFLSTFTYILSLLSKEVILVLPFIIILYNLCCLPKDKPSKVNKAVVIYLIITAVYIAASFFLFRFQKTHLVVYKAPLLFRIITAIKALFIYLGLLLFPQNLHMERISPIINSVWDISGLLSLLAFLIILAFIIKMYKHSKLFFFASLWFLVNLFPVSGILFRLTAIMAEHWLYIPSIGYFLVVALFFRKLQKNKILPRNILIGIICIITLFYSLVTIRQNRVWAEPIKFFERLIRYSPQSSKPYSNLGMLYQEKGDYQKAIQYYNRALEINLNDLVLNQVGIIYIEINQLKEAQELFNGILRNNPRYANAYNNLGNICIKKGEYQKAITFFKKAININSQDSKFHDNLGLAYLETGDLTNAINELRLAIRLNPDNAEVYNNLGNLYSQRKSYDEAISYYQQAIKLKSDFAKAHFNLGVIYFKKNLLDQAKREWERVLEINPQHPGALKNLKSLRQYSNLDTFPPHQ